MTQQSYPIDDVFASARGAAAQLTRIFEALSETVGTATAEPAELKQLALALQAQVQRACLGVMALATHAGRLQAFAHARALEVERDARFLGAAREEVEHEANKDARLYLDDTAPGREPLERWAAEAFAGQWEDFWQTTLGVDRDLVEGWYRVAFERAVKGGAS